MANKSDYKDPRTNLFKLLPEVLQSQTNEAVFEDVFNRYLSKPQLEKVDGFAGDPIPNTTFNRQIQEPTPHRQAFQLQPLLYAQVGDVNHLASWVDSLNEVERYGVQDHRLPLWGNALQFNWAPPIDIDKLVNFRDYWWYDEDDPTSDPEYITIENPCISATQRVDAYQETVDTFGDLQTLLALSSADSSMTIAGDLSEVFTKDFVFLVVGSTNATINSTFFTTVSSTYDADTDRTTIIVAEGIGNDTVVDGSISLENYLTILQAQQNCACGDDVGWDIGPWDDNQVGAILWSSGLLAEISHPTEGAWIAANPDKLVGSPLSVPADLSIWYDTTNNQLKQYLSAGSPNWTVVQNNFASIIALVEGVHFWDFKSTCDVEGNAWSDSNKWYHENHVPNFSIAKRATLPIIEYDFNVQLNRWTFTDYVWKYRESDSFSFAATDVKPTLNELRPFKYVINEGIASPVLNKITLSPEFGDQTSVFVEDYQFDIEGDTLDLANNATYTVQSSSYETTDLAPGGELATVIIIKETFSSSNQSETSLSGSPIIVGSGGQMVPRLTSFNHNFLGYGEHWLLDDATPGAEPATGKLLPVPSPPPTPNPQAEIDPLSTPIQVPGVGEYFVSAPVDLQRSFGAEPYVLAMEYTVLPTVAPGGVPAGTVIPLDPRMISRAPIGETVVKVIYNEQQVYGTFNELDNGFGFGSPAFGGSPFSGSPIGSPPLSFGSPNEGKNDGFVDSITLAFDLAEFDTLQIVVAEQAVEDIGRAVVDIRTVEDETQWDATGSPQGSQPEMLSLIQYREVEQLKTDTNQYPLFDIFDCFGNALFDANPLFIWRTDSTRPVNSQLGLRIVGSTTEDYEFCNLLIDADTLPRPVLYTYNCTNGGLRTLWRKGLNDEEYVPEYVDENKNPVTYGDPLGDWEVPDQLYFNADHENRQYLSFPDFISHFRSIVDAQPDFPGVIVPGNQAYLKPEYNFGVGGRIKEFNDSFDTFLSSVFVNNVSPLGIIDFAHDQYEGSLNTIKEIYRSNLLSYLQDTSTENILDFQGNVNTQVITQYELNDFFSIVYGDSNTFIAGSPRIGVENWPATLPFVGLGFKELPHVIEDDDRGILQLIHHDGHRSEPSLTATTRESVIQTLLNTPDPRVPGETYGTQQNTAPPDTYAELSTFLTPRPAIYWYSVVAGVRTLYRFSVAAVGTIAPTGVPAGTLWYDTADNQLKELQADLATWSPVVGSPDGIITSAWEEIDFDEVLVNLLLELETRLYEAAPDRTTLDFDVASTQTSEISCPDVDPTTTEADTADQYFEEAFGQFLRDIGVDDPYSANQFYVATDPFTWNYALSTFTTSPRSGSPSGVITEGWWTQVYQSLYGTPYPHLEPWALQGYAGKPEWWDSVYAVDPDNASDVATYGTRRWKYIHGTGSPLPVGMWENIRAGIVPAGRALPDGTTSVGVAGEVQQWNYFSVNIGDTAVDGFDPDDVFPPFWDYIANGGTSIIRSVFSDFAGDIVLPNDDYTFETGGPVKFAWQSSSQRLYDDLNVGFRMQPVRFIHSSFGVDFITVDGKQINQADCKVYSHSDVMFHGDIVNTNEVLKVEGINQWYVNFNRYNGFDVAASDFRQLWAGWEALLTYQFGSIIDTQTLQVSNNNFDITERDYQVLLKRSPGIANKNLDALKVTVLESPNRLARFDTQHLWKLQVDTFFPTTRALSYYEVHDYPVRADVQLNTLKVYQYDVVDVDTGGVFYLSGDQVDAFTTSQTFTIAGSTANNGTYTATNISFNPSTNRTSVVVGTTLDSTADGYLTATYRTHPWETGDKIELTSSQSVPAPLAANREYFVIKIDDTTFQLASTQADALEGRQITLSSAGVGEVRAGQVFSKFVALDGVATDRVWNHYVIDRRFTRSIVPPQRVTGIQNFINIIDGYAVVTSEDGWVVNLDSLELDPDSGQPVSWNIETERFIDQAFRLPRQRAALPDEYPVSVDPIADTFTFNNESPIWQTGTKISFSAGTGTLPVPLIANQTYYLIRIDDTTVQAALTASDAVLGIPVNIISGGSALISIFETPTPSTRNPILEINPFRNNVWINTPRGILSNVVDGPTDDIRNTQLITDQRTEQLTGEQISVFRWDKLARVFIPNVIPNPDVPVADTTPYNTLHMSSLQTFVDGYETVMLFNDYAVDGTLIYDPFIGLNQARFFLQFFRQDEFTQRPVVGGYFLTAEDQLLRNIEASALDLQNVYDTYRVLETTPAIIEGRRTLGYQSTAQTFLDEVGLNPKSKFVFWRGMIQSKGSVKAIDAFTNSVRFESSDVDEYWAYKVADFGSNYQQEYPALNLFIEDSQRNEKRLEFLAPQQTVEDAANTFEGVLLTDQARWYNQPDVLQDLADNNSSFYFDAEITTVENLTNITSSGSPEKFYYETSIPFDDVLILNVQGDTLLGSPLVAGTEYTVINSKLIEFDADPRETAAPDPFVIAQSSQVGSPLDTFQWISDNDVTTWTGPTAFSTLSGVANSARSDIAYDGTGTWVSVGFSYNLGSPLPGSGNYGIFYSTDDGTSWTPAAIDEEVFGAVPSNIAYGNGLFCAVGSSIVLTSPDGITWTDQTGATPALQLNWTDVMWDGEQFVAITQFGGTSLATSPDGVNWTIGTYSIPLYAFTCITSTITNSGVKRWYAGTSSVGFVYYSDDDGTTWINGTVTGLGSPSNGSPRTNTWLQDDIFDIAAFGDDVVAVGRTAFATDKRIIYSNDAGESFKEYNIEQGSPAQLTAGWSVIYTPGYGFVVGGQRDSNAVIMTSTDGAPPWTTRVEVNNGGLTYVSGLGSKFVPGGGAERTLRLYTFNPAEDKLNPTKVIDVKDDVVIAELPIWDPRKDYQYTLANNVVTFESTIDPATYTVSLDTLSTGDRFWNDPEVGTVWWDTLLRDYYPYDDPNIFGLDDRILNWGKLSDFASVDLYQWTKSDIPPSEWDATAEVEELNITIDPQIRKTGRVKVETFQRERSTIDVLEFYPSTANTGSPQFPVNTIIVDDQNMILSLGDRIVFTTTEELPLPLETGTFYYIVSLDNTTPALTEITISLEAGGDVLEIKPGPQVIALNADASVSTGSTGLVNDFDTSGIQNVSFTTSKSLGSLTGLTPGTRGYQEVSYSASVSSLTSTNLSAGTSGSQTIPYVTSCATATGLASGFYELIFSNLNGTGPVTFYVNVPVASTYNTLAGAIATAMGSQATVSCETSSSGIVITSTSSGVGSDVIMDETATPAFFNNLLGASGLNVTPTNTIAGGPAPNYEMQVTIDAGSAQTIEVNGADAQTFGNLVTQINNELTNGFASITGGNLRITSNNRGDSSTVEIVDVDLIASTGPGSPVGGTIETAVPGTSVTYQTSVAVDGGGEQTAIVTGDDAQTYSQLITQLNNNLTGLTVGLQSGDLRYTSNSTGSNSTIDITEVGSPPGLLYNLSDVVFPFNTPVDGVDATAYTTEVDLENGPRLITLIGNEIQTWGSLISEFNDQLPAGVLSTFPGSPGGNDLYLNAGNTTVTITNDNLFTRLGETTASPQLSAAPFFDQFIPQNTGDGSHDVVPPFSDEDWIQLVPVVKQLISARDRQAGDLFDVTTVTGSPSIIPNSIQPGDNVNVYVNGALTQTGTVVPNSGLIEIAGTSPQDFITIYKLKHVVTDEQAAFDPDTFDDGTNLIQYKNDFNYSTTTEVDNLGVQSTNYYFWVENKTVRENDNISLRQAVLDLSNIPTPYTIFDNLQGELFGSPQLGSPTILLAPRRYTQLILRGLAGVVDDTDRYVLRFTRDFTLRDELLTRNYTTDLTAALDRVGAEPLDLKSAHTEWTLIRERQPFNIPRDLWDKVTESMIGRLLSDAGSRVPSIAREVYDLTYDKQTRYGLGSGQAFVDGELALATLIDDLQDPTNDFTPIDINAFFASHNFDTEAGLIEVMDDIYNQFPFTAVNRIWFKILLDALTTKQKYPDIFKTSWVALSGTQVFETEELFTG